jgi:four helix bundle protein
MRSDPKTSTTRARSFEELLVWKRSMELAELVHRLTRQFPREELFGLTSQLRRAATSIPSNIAEGFGRINRREFRRFLLIARGSNCELQTQLKISKRLEYGSRESLDKAIALSDETGRMLYSLLEKLRAKLD